MEPSTHSHVLKFIIHTTSQGYLAKGVEVPSIILEYPTMEQLKEKIPIAVDCYFKSFPETHDEIFNKQIQIEQVPVTI